jgi:hypothetical protein
MLAVASQSDRAGREDDVEADQEREETGAAQHGANRRLVVDRGNAGDSALHRPTLRRCVPSKNYALG